MTFAEEPEYLGFVDRLRRALPTADADAAWAAERVLSETAATALALATRGRSRHRAKPATIRSGT